MSDEDREAMVAESYEALDEVSKRFVNLLADALKKEFGKILLEAGPWSWKAAAMGIAEKMNYKPEATLVGEYVGLTRGTVVRDAHTS